MAKELSKHAQDLLRYARMQGEKGYPVYGIPDRDAVFDARR